MTAELTLEKLREDYPRWHAAEVASGEIDPVYPVLRNLADAWGLDFEQRAWLVFCHVIWYHPGSTLAGFQIAPTPAALPDTEDGLWASGLLTLPCGTERRSHRPKGPLINHLRDLKKTFADGVEPWLEEVLSGSPGPRASWLQINTSLTHIVGNGRWAAYKTAEMLQKVADVPLVATDAGHRYSSGPRKGLELLEPHCPRGQKDHDIETLDLMTGLWADLLGEPDLAQVETSLCDFNSLVRGRYYLGHDIDSMLGAWLDPKVAPAIPQEAWDARAASFAPWLLGELSGRSGVDRDANKHYRKTGELLYVD